MKAKREDNKITINDTTVVTKQHITCPLPAPSHVFRILSTGANIVSAKKLESCTLVQTYKILGVIVEVPVEG